VRSLVYYVASTLDGFIAREDGSFDCFLAEGEHFADLVRWFPETIPGHLRDGLGIDEASQRNQRFDTVLMGRRTYEVGLNEGVTNPYPHLAQYVFSHSLSASPDPAVTLVRDAPLETVRDMKARPGGDIWLCGGGALAAALLPEIDEFLIKLHPVIIGAGIPLVAGACTPLRLTTIDRRPYDNGFTLWRLRPADAA
jgi:dihydrofolate reductase